MSISIDEEVYTAFADLDSEGLWNCERGGNSVIPSGRGLDLLGLKGVPEGLRCPCKGPFVKPNGDVHQCGCLDSPKIGDVFNGFFSEEMGVCHRIMNKMVFTC